MGTAFDRCDSQELQFELIKENYSTLIRASRLHYLIFSRTLLGSLIHAAMLV